MFKCRQLSANVQMPLILDIVTFMGMINTTVGNLTFMSIIHTSENLKARKVFILQHFSFYERLKFHSQLS